MRRFSFFFKAGLVILLPACGSLDSNTGSAPTLATVEGSLLNPSLVDVSTSSPVRIAVVWRGIGAGRFSVAEDLPAQPVFPSDFTIALGGPPPADAMNAAPLIPVLWCLPDSGIPVSPECVFAYDASAQVSDPAGVDPLLPDATGAIDMPPSPASQYAVGTVVAYLDLNHNGKLDLVPNDASAYVDQILAANSEMTVVYLQGPIPDDTLHDPLPFAPIEDGFGHRATDGYNLLVFPQCLMPWGQEASPYPTCPTRPAQPVPAQDAGPCAPMQWLGMNTPYPLTVTSSPQVGSLMCLNEMPPDNADASPTVVVSYARTAPPYNPAIQPAQYPSPSDPGVCCAPDGSYYTYTTCRGTSSLCQGPNETCSWVGGYERPTPMPAAWPCTQ